jgi:hypothetical protein
LEAKVSTGGGENAAPMITPPTRNDMAMLASDLLPKPATLTPPEPEVTFAAAAAAADFSLAAALRNFCSDQAIAKELD